MRDVTAEEILKTRLWMYQFLSQMFYREPSWTSSKEWVKNNLFRKLNHLEEEKAHSTGNSLLAHTLEAMPNWSLNDWRKTKEEFQRLFYGPGPLPAKPWESVYRSRERIILDEHTLEVRAFYKNWGLEMKQLNQEPDDHIRVELEFMAELTLQALTLNFQEEADHQKWGDLLKAQQEFLEMHLLVWVDQFCKLLSENTEHPLYKGLALFTPEYLQMDVELLQDLNTHLIPESKEEKQCNGYYPADLLLN